MGWGGSCTLHPASLDVSAQAIPEQEYFDNAVLMVAMCKAGVELAFEAMVNVGGQRAFEP